MKFHFSDAEMSSLLKRLTIIVDTRERENGHIIEYLTAKRVQFIVKKLDVGDYAAMIPANEELGLRRDIHFDNCVIERKGSLDELASNLTKERSRIESELLRAGGSKVFLMIEGATWQDLMNHKYRSQYTPQAFAATLRAFEARYGINIAFTPKDGAGAFIHSVLFYHAREQLLQGLAA